jgi:hypothetical protein
MGLVKLAKVLEASGNEVTWSVLLSYILIMLEEAAKNTRTLSLAHRWPSERDVEPCLFGAAFR